MYHSFLVLWNRTTSPCALMSSTIRFTKATVHAENDHEASDVDDSAQISYLKSFLGKNI